MVMRWRRTRISSEGTPSWRRRCEERIHAIGIPPSADLTVEDLCAHLGELHGRPISLMALSLPSGSPDGLLVSSEDHDYIVLDERLAPVHQRQVALHEVGHFICDHEATPVMTPESSRLLLPALDPALVHRVLGRDHSQSDAELEAEYVGSIIGQRISTWAPPRRRVPPEAHELALRLSALEGPARTRIHE